MAIVRTKNCLLLYLFVITLIAMSSHSIAQESTSELFPTNPDAWLNSPPISSDTLKDKAAILYFFEEG